MIALLLNMWLNVWTCNAVAQQLDVYRMETVVANQSEAERVKAAKATFGDVILRVTGDAIALQHPLIRQAINEAPNYLLRFNYAWEFENNGQAFTVKADGQLVFNSIIHVLNAAVDGIGLAYVPEQLVAPYLADGRLQEVLAHWCPEFQGYHLYYPNRRQASPAFTALVQALKYRS